jgi:hypothetical protein
VRLKWIIRVLLATGCVASCQSQYRILPGEADKDGCNPTLPARICLGTVGTAHCYTPPSDKDYIFGLEPKARTVGRLDGQELTLFTAMFSGCGSGTLTKFALLTIEKGELVNLLPEVELSNQSEYRFWSLPQISSLPVLVTADFIWDREAMTKSNYTQETHFARHRYNVEAFVFDTKSGRYAQKVSYETRKKYPGLDDVDEIKVLNAEKPTILSGL